MSKQIFQICLTCTEPGHNKFWDGSIIFDPTATNKNQWVFEARYGPIGVSGTVFGKQYASLHEAVNSLLGKIKEKSRKKYLIKSIAPLDLSVIPEIVSKKAQLIMMLGNIIRQAFDLSASWKLPLIGESDSPEDLLDAFPKKLGEKTVAEIMRERAKNAPVII